MSGYIATVALLIAMGYIGVRWGVYYVVGFDTLPRNQREIAKQNLTMWGLATGLFLALGYTMIYLEKLPP